MKRVIVSLLLLATVFTGLSCGCSLPAAAEELAESFYDAIEDQDFEKALEYCSEDFFAESTEEDFYTLLNGANAKLGTIIDYELAGWRIQKQAGISELKNGTYYILLYEVEYSRHDAQETLTLFKPYIGGEIQVLGYFISSEGFME